MAGAVSTTFWWRRWTEQSRSKRCTVSVPSARICTSMWRGESTYLSMKTEPSPKAVRASEEARRKFSSSSSAERTTRMPRPPPPKAALMMTGKPISLQNSLASATSVTASAVPGTTGTLYLCARARASVLSPNPAITLDGGPTKEIPCCSHSATNLAFSERKPYPGWIASTPSRTASATMSSYPRYAPTGLFPSPTRKDSSALYLCREPKSSLE
mmetsp:Transcript_1177/g.2467  ORF Transcript_1177/g.2467 Transcript_1177/m.2467 type:complete len:214 (+) Transcript_1177:384-1025(+)